MPLTATINFQEKVLGRAGPGNHRKMRPHAWVASPAGMSLQAKRSKRPLIHASGVNCPGVGALINENRSLSLADVDGSMSA